MPRPDIRLTPDEEAAFLRDNRKCALATIDQHGFPHVVAMNFRERDGAYYMTSYGKAQKVLNIRRNPKVGINIAPLLAGAGIIGVAIGFGSQKLVQDVVTGMFVLFENAIQVGDWVTVSGLSGKVEQLSVRTIWLRGGDGALHIVPFSAVSTISNTNRGLGTAAVAVTVAYREDSDRAAEAMRGIAAGLRQDPEYADKILDDLQLWVDSVRALGVTLAGTISCTDAGRWPVQREFNRRLQKRFKELEIDLGLKLGDA
jgi:small-conductance mechanosensitive channel